MISAEGLSVFLKLQQIVLDTEDKSAILNNFIPQACSLLSTIHLAYESLTTIFLNTDNRFMQLNYAKTNDPSYHLDNIRNLIKLENLLIPGGYWEKYLNLGKVVVIKETSYYLQETYPRFHSIKSIIISPIRFNRKTVGLLILTSPKEAEKITKEELEMVNLINNLIGFAYQIQDTQASLTHITQEVYKVNTELHQLDRLKDDFVSVASHELRTPMTAIRSYVWMALNRPDITLSEKMKKYLGRTLTSTERLINLVNDMLNVSRIESGSIEIRPESFDIRVLVEEVITEVGPKALEKFLVLNMEKGSPLNVFADKDKVHQILLNLIGNSLKFVASEGKINVSFFPDGKMVEIAVKDNGVGISEDNLSRLFKKFGRLDDSYVSSATSGGTGLGLFISKNLIELMGGKIWASSEGTGRGATFTFSLPLATPEVLREREKYTRKPAGEIKILEPVVI
ncbi:MAG: HAMP domain-containing sensor histidine kinase [Candidatus Daviesbacteria bacterium]|nr:HAMP domain-containing sensor histidine kinase [Candidatus Daviesbacteria bacterium]